MDRRAVRLTVTGGSIVHLYGLPWYRLPIPWLLHRCRAATIADLGVMYPEHIERCACGGYRIRHFGSIEYTAWRECNSRRRGCAHNLTTH